MSLLMDALRKAEEAKKKAAQEAKSEEAESTTVAEALQASAADGESAEGSSPSEVDLSIAEIGEVPARSAVPNIESPLDFEDEEDYVLPSSVGTPEQAELGAPQARAIEDEDSAELERDAEPPAQDKRASVTRSEAADLLGFDNLQVDDEESASDTPAREAPAGIAASVAKQPPAQQNEPATLVPLGLPEKALSARADESVRSRDEPRRRTARNVFAAKKPSQSKRRNIQIAAGAGLFLVVVVFGTFFYISLNQQSSFNIPAGSYVPTDFVSDAAQGDSNDGFSSDDNGVLAEPVAGAAAQNAGLANLDTVNDGLSDALALGEILEAAEVPQPVEVPQTSRSPANLQPETLVVETPRLDAVVTTIGDDPVAEPEVAVSPEPARSIVADPAPSAAAIEPSNLISFRRQANVVTVDPNLDRAFAAYQRGSLDEAEGLYRQALAGDPLQRDALIGLATIAARNGNSGEALDLYSRLLARNPRDPIARAGLMEILPAGSPATQEADLKRLLNEYPNIAALAYAQGNFLASNQRWSEAQQAYFRALQLAKTDAAISGVVNPDYAFNLAVSLEHLNQSAPAQNYYREALEFAANHPAGFDLVAVRSRLAAMAGGTTDD